LITIPRRQDIVFKPRGITVRGSENALAINVILKAAMASPPQIAASCTSSSIASAAVGDLFAQPVTKRLVVLVGQKKAFAMPCATSRAGGWLKLAEWLSADIAKRYVSA
jgi:hypothetical protein